VSTGSYIKVPHRNRRREARCRLSAAATAARPRMAALIESLESRTLLTAVLSDTADAYIRNNAYASTNFGASSSLYVQNASSGDNRIALLKFDLSGVSAITSATLRVTGSLEYPDSGAVHLNVYQVSDPSWVEGSGTSDSFNGNGTDVVSSAAQGVSWNTAPSISPTALSTVLVNHYGLQTYSLDLTTFLQQQQAAGNNVVSIALDTAEAGTQWLKFLSRESGPYGPQLVVFGTGASEPTGIISAADVTDPTAATTQISVTYSDEAAIDPSSIAASNLAVSGPAGPLNVLDASVSQNGSGNTVTAVYDVSAPSGGWVAADNGLYTVTLQGNQVRDTNGNFAPTAEGQFRVSVGDATPPTASISAPNLTAANQTYQFTVTYADDVAIDTSWIDVDNVSVTNSAGASLPVLSAQVDNSSNGTPRTVTYTVASPEGSWTSADNGTYTINYGGVPVRDTAGNPAPAASTTFQVGIGSTAPTAAITAPSINAAGGANELISVVYTSSTAISAASITVANLTVTGPAGPLTVTGVSLTPSQDSSQITAVYTVAAPGGQWQASDDGNYTVTLDANQVTDTIGNTVPTTSAGFGVAINVPDTTPPSAQITAPDITKAGGTVQMITIIYTDNVAVNAASISPANITVSGPLGPLVVTAAQAQGGDGSPLVATYTIAAPGGTWTDADNGSYVVALNANQVDDTSGNFAGGASGSFTVNIPATIGGPNDQTFNNGNPVTTSFIAEAIVTASDGSIIAVGRQGDLAAGTSQGVIEHFNSDGTPDTSFGSHGMILSEPGVNEAYFAVVMQDATHFIVAGTSGGDFVLARYSLSGNLDASFGTNGRVITDFGTTSDTARAVAVTPAGLIVAAGDSGGNFAFARYSATGALDPNFAQNGRQLYGVGNGANNGLGAMAVQSDGSILAIGSEGSSVVVVRLTASGEADGTFGNGGLVTVAGLVSRTDLGGPDRSEGFALESNGDILVANRTAQGHFGLVRLNPNGNVDTTFGTNGLTTANFGGDDDADSVVIEAGGPIIVVGTSLQNGNTDTAVVAFDPAGNPMSSFGTNGLLLMPSGVSQITSSLSQGGVLHPAALHIGDIVLRAFGARTSDGRVVIGTTNEAVAATTSSTLRRLIVPGAEVGTSNAGSLLGSFGIVNGKRTRLTVTDADGTKITFSLTGGTGTAYESGDRITLIINDLGKGVVLTITGHGGDGRVSLADVTISGTLRAMTARNSDIFGTLHVTGAIGQLTVGNISGSIWSGASIASLTAGSLSGNVFATGALGRMRFTNVSGTIASGSGVIGTLAAASLTNARVLSGANLGADGAVGGSGANADTYGAGSIGSIKVKGRIITSFIGAGANPVDQTFGNTNDTVVGGPASLIRSISAKSADQASRFEAGAFGVVKLPKLVKVLQDSRFRVL